MVFVCVIERMAIDDPAAYEKPWTVSFPFARSEGYQLFDYECHEGNQAIGLVLRGARTLEREAATKR